MTVLHVQYTHPRHHQNNNMNNNKREPFQNIACCTSMTAAVGVLSADSAVAGPSSRVHLGDDSCVDLGDASSEEASGLLLASTNW